MYIALLAAGSSKRLEAGTEAGYIEIVVGWIDQLEDGVAVFALAPSLHYRKRHGITDCNIV